VVEEGEGGVGVGDSVSVVVGEEVGLADGLVLTDMVGLGDTGAGFAGITTGTVGLGLGVAR